MHEEARSELERLAGFIVDSGLKVHRALGPGLLASAYEHCLAHELENRGLKVDRQVLLPIVYEGVRVDAGYRLDLIEEKSIIVEVKVAETLTPVHYAQLLTYIKPSS